MSDSKKLFRDLTDDELIEEAMKAVPDYLEKIRSTGNFDLDVCVKRELERLERLFKIKHGIRVFFQIDSQERLALNAVLTRLRPVLIERTRAIQLRYLQSRKVSQLNAVTAKALIEATFKAAGLCAEVSGQRYRARVEVPMPPGHAVRFYISYKKLMMDGVLEDAVEAVKNLVVSLRKLGYGTVVKRM